MTIVKLSLDQYDGVAVASTGHASSTVMPDGVMIDFDGVLTLNGVEIPSPLALRSGWVNRGVAAQARADSLAGPANADPDNEDAVSAYAEAVGELAACDHMITLFDRCEAGEFTLRDLPDVARNEPATSAPPSVRESEPFGRVLSGLVADATTTSRYEWLAW